MIAAAHAWAGGADFATLRECTMLQEGDIVRVLSRVEELAKEVKFAAWLLGDAQLGKTSEAVLSGIKRDVAAVPSLYTDGLERVTLVNFIGSLRQRLRAHSARVRHFAPS